MSLMLLSPNPPSLKSVQIHLFVRQRITVQILFILTQQGGMLRPFREEMLQAEPHSSERF